jgi:hypothetical protein
MMAKNSKFTTTLLNIIIIFINHLNLDYVYNSSEIFVTTKVYWLDGGRE